MSIYATLWTLKFPKDGDDYPGCEWIAVTAQGVPAHIGSSTDDPCAAFLPPPIQAKDTGEAELMRAVVFIKEGTRKGTYRSPQEYVDPLLVLTGEAYANMTFKTLHTLICDALRGNRPRMVATTITPDGRVRILFEDGTVKEVNT